LLEWTTDYLKTHGADSPRLDAEILLAQSLACRRIELYTRFQEEPDEDRRSTFRGLVKRRAEGTPVAYLVGRQEFFSLSFAVTPDVLIPRPETELLVVALLDLAKGAAAGRPIRVADIGAGSGILAVCAAKYLPLASVTAVDISPPALAVAKSNAAEHGVAERIRWVEGDLFSAVPEGERFDFIVSNPPYISTAEMEALAPEVKNHEPRVALAAGPRGTDVIERLIPAAAERLEPGGHLLMEISPMIHDRVRALVENDGRFELGETMKDLARLPRVVRAKRV
jgi:release factor glutamine methyltransferase